MERFTPAPNPAPELTVRKAAALCEHCLDCSAEANITNTPPPIILGLVPLLSGLTPSL